MTAQVAVVMFVTLVLAHVLTLLGAQLDPPTAASWAGILYLAEQVSVTLRTPRQP